MTRTWLPALSFPLATAAVAQEPPARPSDDEARAARLALQRAELEAEIAAMEKFGRHDELLARLAPLIDAPDFRERSRELYLPVGEKDALYWQDVEAFVRWHRPLAAGEQPAWADVAARDHPLPVIVDFRDQLRAHDIELLVVAIPSRFEIEPGLLLDLPSTEGFVGMGIGTAHLLLDLNQAGIETLDLRPAFAAARTGPAGERDDRLFLRGDQHWTPRGAELAASLVAARVTTLPWFAPGPLREGKDYTLARGPIEVVISHKDRLQEDVPFAECREVVPATRVLHGEEPFDCLSERSRFVVLGDSFTDLHLAKGCSFTTQLARLLGHKVDLVSALGGGARESRAKLSTWKAARWANRKLVIWCLPTQVTACWRTWQKLEIFRR